jgi:hypothetical protein
MAKTLEDMRGDLSEAFDLAMTMARDSYCNGHYENSLAARSQAITAACNAAQTLMNLDDKIAERDGRDLGKPATSLPHNP